MDKEKLKEAIAFARENHLSCIEVEGIKMTLADLPMDLEPNDGKDIPQPLTPYDNLSDEEVTFWSTNYFDDLQVKKELKKQHQEESEQTRGE